MESNTQYVIDKIRKEVSIKEYLSSKGIEPEKQLADGCALYLCPIHGDTDPSLRVWPPNVGKYPYENYKCFGCKSGHDILSIYTELSCGGNWRKALTDLSERVDCSFSGSIDFLIDQIKLENEKQNFSYYEDSLECYYIKISDLLKNYLSLVNNDLEEEQFVEKIYNVVDSYLWSYNLGKIKESYRFLSENNSNKKLQGQSPLKHRYISWRKKQEEKLRKKLLND